MKKLNSILILASALAFHVAHAQGVDVVSTPFVDTPQLPIPLAAGASSMAMPVAKNWDVLAEDLTIRGVLTRWANASNWVFTPAHWTVKSDLPITGGTSFYGDFKSAVRSLVSSTELTDMPLQPCFYSNGVLRIVPKSELCDRTANSAAQPR